MIDKTNEVYDRVADAIVAEFPDCDVSSVYVDSPSAFPHVTIICNDSNEPSGYMDSSGREKIRQITFKVDVYSDKESGAASECRSILAVANDVLRLMNFSCITSTPSPNMYNTDVYRITAMYQASAGENEFYAR